MGPNAWDGKTDGGASGAFRRSTSRGDETPEIGLSIIQRIVPVPRFLDLEPREELLWQAHVSRITEAFENMGKDSKTLPRSCMFYITEANGTFRPGHLGPRREDFIKTMDNLFGENAWMIKHRINGRMSPIEKAWDLFEEAYVVYLRKNPDVLNNLTTNYRDVYDTAESNVHSGFDYSIQEAPELGAHIHDIAIRRAVKRLGRTFEGDKLLQVRGKGTEGHHLSPGQVPFEVPGISFESYKNGWWNPGSIEDFYQGTRQVVVIPSSKNILSEVATEYEPEMLCERVAARFVHSLIAHLEGGEIPISRLTTLPWKLHSTSLPTDQLGRFREFSDSEIKKIITSCFEILDFIGRRDPELKNYISPGLNACKRLQTGIVSFLDTGTMAVSENPRAKQDPLIFKEIKEAFIWGEHVPKFYHPIKGETKLPVFLARDGLAPAEYVDMRALISGNKGTYFTLYLPGAPEGIGKNKRGVDPIIKDIVLNGERIARDVLEEGGVPAELNKQYIAKFQEWLAMPENESHRIFCHLLYEQVVDNITALEAGKQIVIMDTHGSGKTALTVKAILEFFEQSEQNCKWSGVDIIIGQQVKKIFGADFSNLFEIKTLAPPADTGEDAIFPDIRWPFNFMSTANETTFDFKAQPSCFLKLHLRSLLFYNAAVRDMLSFGQATSSRL